MTDQEAEARRFLESARRALSPTAEDAERVLSAVNQAIALSGAQSFEATAPKSGTSLLSAPLRGPLSRVLLTVALAGGAGALGYGAGFRAGAQSVSPSASAPRELSAPLATLHEAAARRPRDEPSAGAATELSPAMPVRAAPAHAVAPASSPTVATVTAQRPDASSLSEEVRTLRRVERALRDQNPRLALALLGDLDKEVPVGQLGEERLAASVQARCAYCE